MNECIKGEFKEYLDGKSKPYDAFHLVLKMDDSAPGRIKNTSFLKKKLEPDPESLADVMLYYVECVQFTNDFGDIDEPFYNSIAGMFNNTAKFFYHTNISVKFL